MPLSSACSYWKHCVDCLQRSIRCAPSRGGGGGGAGEGEGAEGEGEGEGEVEEGGEDNEWRWRWRKTGRNELVHC